MNVRALTLALCLALVPGGTALAGGWRYVVPPPGDPFAHPPPRALALTDRKPADLKESVPYRGKRQRYAQLAYGTGRQAALAVVVDEVGPNEIDLYVDADRDRAITAKDRVPGKGLTRRLAVKAVVTEGDTLREFPRTLLFRYGPVSRTLAVATCGYLEGRADLGGKKVAVRRVDGDANGLFADPQDRVWIDLNADGDWDAAEEEFLFTPILRLGGKRFAVRADARGERLTFAPVEGTGTLRLKLPAALKAEQVEEIQVTVQSRDGVVASARGLGEGVTLPTGEYRVSSLLLTLKGPKGEPAWGYVFGDNGGKGHRWHRLDKGGTLTVDPVGILEFTAAVGDGKAKISAGETVSVRPALYTGDGLLIERAYRGRFQSGPGDSGCGGKISLRDEKGGSLASAHTGFA
jgi:hypothetical protein